ncbi:MAG: hypothetical protein IKM30_03880 [Oscillospiraceae bacterium]|nr:hypothetical protein [Oscillospiraceae bacterium]
MAWKTIHTELAGFDENGTPLLRAELVCDTAEDLPDAVQNGFAPMSLALIAATHDIYVLNTKGEWK